MSFRFLAGLVSGFPGPTQRHYPTHVNRFGWIGRG